MNLTTCNFMVVKCFCYFNPSIPSISNEIDIQHFFFPFIFQLRLQWTKQNKTKLNIPCKNETEKKPVWPSRNDSRQEKKNRFSFAVKKNECGNYWPRLLVLVGVGCHKPKKYNRNQHFLEWWKKQPFLFLWYYTKLIQQFSNIFIRQYCQSCLC